MAWTCFLVFFMLGFFPAQSQDSSECPENYVKIHRSCYKFVTDGDLTVEWAESPDGCDGNNLVLVQSVAEMQKLEEYMNKNKFAAGKYWVGVKKETAKGDKPKWLDNSDVAQPIMKSSRRRYDCSAINLQPNQLQIVLHDCDDTLPYICEYTQITARPQTATTTPDMQIADSSVLPTGTIRLNPSIPKSATPGNASDTPATQGPTKPTVYVHPPTETPPTSNTHKAPEVSRKEKVPEVSSHASISMSTESTTLKTSPTTTTTVTTPTTTRPSTTTTTTSTTTSRKTTTSSTTTATTTATRPTKRTTTTAASTTTTSSVETKLKAYKNCYIPSFGSNLMEQLITAETFYTNPRVCPNTTIGSVNWPSTLPGQTAQVRCKNRKGTATWACSQQETKVCWIGQPDVSGCVDEKLQKILNLATKIETPATNETKPTELPPSGEKVVEMTSQIKEVTTAKETTMEDVMVMSRVLTFVTKKKDNAPLKDIQEIKDIVDNVIAAGSNLVSTNKSAMWEEMTQVDKVNSASTLLVAMETATLAMAEEIKQPIVITQQDENIDLKLHVISEDTFTKENKTELVYTTDQSDTTFTIPKETLFSFNKEGELAKVVFMTHYSMADILGVQEKPKTKTDPEVKDEEKSSKKKERMEEKSDIRLHIASYILSASLGADGHAHKLPKPVTFRMKHVTPVDPSYRTLCSFWKISDGSSSGYWSQDGCKVESTNATYTTCECDHLTNFAILLDVHALKTDKVHKEVLDWITKIGCIISCTALLASWITFQCFSSLQGERNSIHKNLVVCLFVAEIVFVLGISETTNNILCSVIAGFLHYFFLAAFTWMLMEGLHIIFMLVQVFDASKSRLPYYYLAGYGVPLIIVGTSCLFYYSGYGTSQYCWLTTERYFIWAFAGPVAIILLVNALILAYALSTVCRHSEYVFSSKDKSTGSGLRSWIQGALALEVLLGLTWTFGYFVINEDSIALAYIFTIMNSLQGLFIFVFHCLLNKKTQKEYRSVMHTVVSRSSSSAGSHSTLTKRTNPHSHELTHSHQKLTNTNSHSLA